MFFTDLPLFSPSIVEINGGAALNAASSNTLVYQSPITLSGDRKEAWVTFDSLLDTGEFFDLHVPIENLGTGDGSFVLTQTPTAIPEPASVIVWSLLGIGWAGLCVWRRRGKPRLTGGAGGASPPPWSNETKAAIVSIIERGRMG